ncbi:ATP-binding protein [Sphingomonas sp. Ant H11]|uniref:ATP-binding protein n=1 Tax=Sphingomonas sp. Ant H11 TaxID=1564113 RepID=UPI000AD0A9A8|nr:ATP-binding protein [Sphingomonas sp. Ant H11]
MSALDRAAVERFGGDLAHVLGGAVPPDAPIALAVSGGPDSMAMLALAAAAFPGQVHAATVDHRLRAAAAAEARMVAAWCANAGVPHTTLVVAEPIGPGSVQARAGLYVMSCCCAGRPRSARAALLPRIMPTIRPKPS